VAIQVVRFSWYVGEFESYELERLFRKRSAAKKRARMVLGSSSVISELYRLDVLWWLRYGPWILFRKDARELVLLIQPRLAGPFSWCVSPTPSL
jgi:hypothetical protein